MLNVLPLRAMPKTPTEECFRCQKPMAWQSVLLVEAQPMNIFHCVTCDLLAAAAEYDFTPASTAPHSRRRCPRHV